MNTNVRATQVLQIDTAECTSACADNSTKATSPRISCIERKWSWIIVAASFWNQFVVLGILQTLGLYNVEFLEALGDSKSRTAWITSVAGACILGLGPLSAAILDRTSARVTACLGGVISTLGLLVSWSASSVIQLSITFGVVMGFGLSMIFLSSTVIVGQYFQKRRALATAFSSCGGSLGCLILPLLVTYIIDKYTWRGSLFILAALCFQTVVLSSLLRPAPSTCKTEVIEPAANESKSINEQCNIILCTLEGLGTLEHVEPSRASGSDDTGSDRVSCSEHREDVMDVCFDAKNCSTRSSNRGLLITMKNKILHSPLNNLGMFLYCIVAFLGNIGVGAVLITLPDFIYISSGAKDISAIMLMCMAAGRIGGAIIASGLGNWKPLHCLHMNCASNVIMGIVTFLYTCTTHIYVFGVLSCLFGIALASVIAWITQVIVNLVGIKNMAQAIGYVLAACGSGWLIGPPLAGALFDVSDDYLVSFWVAAGVLSAAGILPVIVLLKERCRKEYDVTKAEP